MAKISQNMTLDESLVVEVTNMAATDSRTKSSMFNVLVREALEARYEAGFEADNNAQESKETGA